MLLSAFCALHHKMLLESVWSSLYALGFLHRNRGREKGGIEKKWKTGREKKGKGRGKERKKRRK